MPKVKTKENILLLVCLRFAGRKTTAIKIAEFLGISRRHANVILNELIARDLARVEGKGIYYIKGVPKKGIEVISNILYYVSTLLTPKSEGERKC